MSNEPSIQDLSFKITRKYQKSPQRITNIKSIISVNKIYCGKTLTQFDAEVMIRANEKQPFKQPPRQLPKSVRNMINIGTSTSSSRKNQNLTSSGMQTDNTISVQERDFNYITWGGRLSKILDKERQQVNSGGPSILERMNYIRSNSPQRFKRTDKLKKQIEEASIKQREGLEGSMRIAAESDMPKNSQEANIEGIDILNEDLTCNALSSYDRKKQNLSKIMYGGDEEKNYERQWVEGNRVCPDKNQSKNQQDIDAGQFLQGQLIDQMETPQDYNTTPDIKIVSAEIIDILDANCTETEQKYALENNTQENTSVQNLEINTSPDFDDEVKREEGNDTDVQQPVKEPPKQEESTSFDDDDQENSTPKPRSQYPIDQNIDDIKQEEEQQEKNDNTNLFSYQIIKNSSSIQNESDQYIGSNLDRELNKIVHSTLKLEENALDQDDEETFMFDFNQCHDVQYNEQATPQTNQSLFKHVPTQKEIDDNSSQCYVSDIREETELTNDSYYSRTRCSVQSQLQNQVDTSTTSGSDPLVKPDASEDPEL